MSQPLTRLQARIASQLGRERLGERFAPQVPFEAAPVAAPGLARVDGQLVPAMVGEETRVGELVAMANVGRPAAAMYAPQAGGVVVLASGSASAGATAGGVTVHAQLSGLRADDHPDYLNIERGDGRYYTEVEEDAWRVDHSGQPDIHHKHATGVSPLSIDADQVVRLAYNSTLLVDNAGDKLGVNQAYAFAWSGSHQWALGTVLSSAGTVIPPGVSTGYGWSINNPESGDATLTIPNIYVGSLHAQAFIADTARVDVGEEVWTRARAVLATDFTAPPIVNTSPTVTPSPGSTAALVVEVPPGLNGEQLHLFGDSHYVRLRVFDSSQGLTIADIWGTVTFSGYTPPIVATEQHQGEPAKQTYQFTMLRGATGEAVAAGTLVMGYGLPGDALVLMTAIADGAPYTGYYRWGLNPDGSVRVTAKPWESQYWKLLTRIGNLEGQVDTAFGGALQGAGLYSENVYLKGRMQIAAGSDVPWSTVSGPDKPQNNATRGAIWDVDMEPPDYLREPGSGSTPGLYLLGTKLGYWSGGSWRTYLDAAGNFIFTGPGVEQTSIAEGTTRLAYLASAGVLGGQVYRAGMWRRTWWTDNATGAMYAGEDGEVLLHEYGLSLLAYTGNEIAPTYNTKAVGFFASGDQIANVNKARARIWAGHNIADYAAGAPAAVKTMLQMEIGIDGDGVIASNNRPSVQLLYMPEMAVLGYSKQFVIDGFGLIELNAVREGLRPSSVHVIADETVLLNTTMVDRLLPNLGSKTIGSSTNKFEAVYAKTVYADTVIAPSFTGQNTVGVELRLDGYGMDEGSVHVWGAQMAWTPVINDGFYNPVQPTRVIVDATGWYRVSYWVQFPQYQHRNWIRIYAADGQSYYEALHAETGGGTATGAGDYYLQSGQQIELCSTPGNGWTTNNKARLAVVRTGTNGLPTTSSVWTAADAVLVRSNAAATTQLRIENSNPSARMNLSVEGEIISEQGLYNGVDLALLGQEWLAHKTAADPHPQYMLKAQVQQVYATQDALTTAIAHGMGGGGGGETYHNALTGLADGDPHSQYVATAFARTITARHTYNPVAGGAPFVIGPNAAGHVVAGLNADLLDGHEWSELAPTPEGILAALLTVDGQGSLLDADMLDGRHASAFAPAGNIVGAGAGLTGGGPLSGSITLAVGAGPGITVLEDAVCLAASVAGAGLVYDNGVLSLAPGVAGVGLVYDTGVLGVGQGFGLVVGADSVAVDTAVDFAWTGVHIFQNNIVARNLLPELTDSYDIGSYTRWWRQQFVSQINAAVFAEQTIQLLGGWLMVTKDAGTFPGEVASSQTQIDFGKPMTQGDFVLIRSHDKQGTIKVEYVQIGTVVSGTTYNVTRDVALANAVDPEWPEGTPFAVLGAGGDGRIELNAYSTPRISLIKQGTAWNSQTELIRLGDINGMGDVTAETWGIWIGTGTQYLKFDGTTLKIAGDGGGITNINGAGIQTGTIDAARLSVANLAEIAGALVVGTTHKLWLNDGGDGALAIGGTSKAAAPFRVTAAGALTATNATLSGVFSTSRITMDALNGVRILVGDVGGSHFRWVKDFTANYEVGRLSSYTDVTQTSTVYLAAWGYSDQNNKSELILHTLAGSYGAKATLRTRTPSYDVQYVFGVLSAEFGAKLLVKDSIQVDTHAVWHAGNDGAGSGLDADLVHGMNLCSSGNWWGTIAYIDTAGVLEIGRYIDFHTADNGTGDYAVRLDAGAVSGGLTINGSTIWHTGNFNPSNHSLTSHSHAYAPLAGAAFAGVVSAPSVEASGSGAQFVLPSRNGGTSWVFYNQSSILRLWANGDKFTWDTSANFWANANVSCGGYLCVASGNGYMQLGPQNNGWCHMTTDRPAWYFDRQVCINGNLYSYNSDFTLGRGTNGAISNRITFYTWGTYVHAHLTMEDVFAIVSVQGVVPNTPASGVKVFLYTVGSVTYLQAKFANGVTKILASNA